MTRFIFFFVLALSCVEGAKDDSNEVASNENGGLWGWVRGKRAPRTDDELKKGIAKFYDESTAIWLDVWGEDLHHGFYPAGVSGRGADHQAAQRDMTDRAIDFAYANEEGACRANGGGEEGGQGGGVGECVGPRPTSMVDVGCGVGGSSRHIARRFPSISMAKGVSLSPYQVRRATAFTAEQGLAHRVSYEVGDAMAMPFEPGTFDLTWSMESGEHMPDKRAFLEELVRVTAPDGRVVVVTWCHRELGEGETGLAPKERRLLDKINRAYYLPDWVPGSNYVSLLRDELGLEDVRVEDWSDHVAPFWPAVIRSSLQPRNLLRLLRTGRTTLHGAVATLWMLRGFQRGVVKFVAVTAKKPDDGAKARAAEAAEAAAKAAETAEAKAAAKAAEAAEAAAEAEAAEAEAAKAAAQAAEKAAAKKAEAEARAAAAAAKAAAARAEAEEEWAKNEAAKAASVAAMNAAADAARAEEAAVQAAQAEAAAAAAAEAEMPKAAVVGGSE